MKTSENINEIAAALAKAQLEIKPATKDAANPYFKSKYADLASVWATCREALGKHGLSVSQVPATLDGKQVLYTRLMHSSGQFIEGVYFLNPVKNDPQGMGSAITYARRYSLCSMVGIVADEDDDGNAASNPDKAKRQTYKEERATYIVPVTTEESGPDYYTWAANYEGMLGTFKTMEEISMFWKANQPTIKILMTQDTKTFEHLKNATSEASNKLA